MSVDKIQKEFGARVRAIRKQRELSQEHLAARVETSSETISNIERGLTWPRLATIIAIADTLEVGVSELLGDPLPPRREHPLIEEIVALLSDRDVDELRAVLDQTRTLLSLSSRKR
jgi:transcriptional regulator with XRE-family HTH domain